MKILEITGCSETIPGLLEAGADACLLKPVDLGLLQQKRVHLLASIEA